MSIAGTSVTARICERIVACGRALLDGKVLPAARQLFLDGIAVGVAGARLEAAPRILAEHFADPLTGTGGGTAASLLGLNARLGTVPAALVNGAAMHVLDFEPMWLPATHASIACARTGPGAWRGTGQQRRENPDRDGARHRNPGPVCARRPARWNRTSCGFIRPASSARSAPPSPPGICWTSTPRNSPTRSASQDRAAADCS